MYDNYGEASIKFVAIWVKVIADAVYLDYIAVVDLKHKLEKKKKMRKTSLKNMNFQHHCGAVVSNIPLKGRFLYPLGARNLSVCSLHFGV